MTKIQAQKIYDRFDEAGLDVAMHRKVDRIDITSWEGSKPEYTAGESYYEVLVRIESLHSPDVLRLIAEQAERTDAKLVPDVGMLKLQ